jgi:hypothetical protein
MRLADPIRVSEIDATCLAPAPARARTSSILMAALAGGMLACDGSSMTMAMMPLPADTTRRPSPDGLSGQVMDPPGFDIPALAQELASGTLSGWIHGAVHPRGLYVFTWRRAGNFFSSLDFPVAPVGEEVAAKLAQVKRHDQVRIKGSFILNAAPIRHIRLQDMEIIKPWASDQELPRRTASTRIPEDILGKKELIGKVHAVAQDGRILVIEHGDAVVPVFVSAPELTEGLFRNDKVRVAFTVPSFPPRPTHLWLDTAAATPLEVMDRLVHRHEMIVVEEGDLVRFPISPQIIVDVYALQVTDADGVSREYTLLNDKSAAVFTSIREKLAAAWFSRDGAMDGRNKLINPNIKVTARGRFNVVAPNQANAQILLESADDLTVTVLP